MIRVFQLLTDDVPCSGDAGGERRRHDRAKDHPGGLDTLGKAAVENDAQLRDQNAEECLHEGFQCSNKPVCHDVYLLIYISNADHTSGPAIPSTVSPFLD